MIDCRDRFVSVANFSLGRKCNKFGLPLKSDSVNHCVLRRSSVEYILILWDRYLARCAQSYMKRPNRKFVCTRTTDVAYSLLNVTQIFPAIGQRTVEDFSV